MFNNGLSSDLMWFTYLLGSGGLWWSEKHIIFWQKYFGEHWSVVPGIDPKVRRYQPHHHGETGRIGRRYRGDVWRKKVAASFCGSWVCLHNCPENTTCVELFSFTVVLSDVFLLKLCFSMFVSSVPNVCADGWTSSSIHGAIWPKRPWLRKWPRPATTSTATSWHGNPVAATQSVQLAKVPLNNDWWVVMFC